MSNSFSLLIFVLLSFSCSSSSKAIVPPEANSETIENTPAWFLNPPEDPNYLFAPATAVSRDMSLAIEKATADARADISLQMKNQTKVLEKRFTEELGTDEDSKYSDQFTKVSQSVTSQTLYGAKVIKRELRKEDNVYRAYVLLQMPVRNIKEDFLNEIEKSKNLYSRFRSGKAFKELDEEVKKYEVVSTDKQLDDLSKQIVASLSNEGVTKIAVTEFSSIAGNTTNLGRFVSEELITRLYRTGKFEIIERHLLKKVLDEQGLNLSGIIDQNSAVEIGKILGVDAIATGTLTDLGNDIKINARIINIETGKIFSVASRTITKTDSIKKLMNDTAKSHVPAG